MTFELTRKLNVPVITMSEVSGLRNADEIYALLNTYLKQVSTLRIPGVMRRSTYVKSLIRSSSKFNASRRTAKVLVRNNYPFVSHTGPSFRRARVSSRLPKP